MRGLTIRQRIVFARENGLGALNISPNAVVSHLANGETLETIRAVARDQGIDLTYLDPIDGW